MRKIEGTGLNTTILHGGLENVGNIHQETPVVCTIGLDSFSILNTRSWHEDTDYVTVSLAIGNKAPVSQTRSLGNLNNGHYPLNMHFSNVTLLPTEIAVLTYAIINNGHSAPSTVEQSLENGLKSLATQGAQIAAKEASTAIGSALGASIGTAALPIIGTALGALAGYLVGGAFGLLFADCDGGVAAGVHALTGAQIASALAATRGMTEVDDNPGTNSADGCGSNSHYTVTWSVH